MGVSFTTDTDLTISVPTYQWSTSYEFTDSSVNVHEAGPFYVPAGAIGIMGKSEGDIGNPTGTGEGHESYVQQASYDTNHNHEYVFTDNETDLAFDYLGNSTAALVSELNLPTYSEGYATTMVSCNADEETFVDSIFGSIAGGDTYAAISGTLDAQLTDISRRIYGTLATDRFAFSRTRPMELDKSDLEQFGGDEVSENTGMPLQGVITGSY